jgi:Cu(I)/Ag(I) efflux system membrane fusion protein/cobalt-zinc-cadmium efflux system membrane fusion protein
MKTRLILTAAVFLGLGIGAGFWLASGVDEGVTVSKQAQREGKESASSKKPKTWYTCGMHPEVVQDHPGDCPKCGMKLQPMSPDRAAAMGLAEPGDMAAVPKGERKIVYWRSPMVPGEIHSESGTDSMGHDLVPVYEDEIAAGSIRIDPVTEQNMGVRVARVTSGPVRRKVRTVGFVEYDETALAVVTTKVDGWVEKLHVDKTGVQVHEGDPLFDLYSPALFSAQEEYLAALRNRQRSDVRAVPRAQFDSDALVRDARTRLEFFDISEQQIRELERAGKVRKTLTIRAPFTGIVTHKNVVEGRMVKSGVDLFQIADLSTVWVIAKVFENALPYVELGQEAFMTLSYIPGKTFRGRVTYVYPYLEEKTREIPVRMEFHNPGYELKPGMYATVTLTGDVAARATLVPDLAVIRTGLRSIAFAVPEPGRFQMRELRVGARSEDNMLQVLSGLAPGETVVVSGQFLLDSESRLREAALKFTEPAAAFIAEPKPSGVAGDAPPDEGELFYVCPMPEHVDILYDEPGNCPICGMETVPVRRHAGHVEKPAPAYWTCPMPEHAQVREDGPGKCPICGMSRIPATALEPKQSRPPETGESGEYWTCPMPEHAQVREEGPGTCPLCGMALIRRPGSEREPESGTGDKDAAEGPYWTCPMPEHAEVRENSPGKCPLCGMNLIRRPAHDAPGQATEEGGHVHSH